MILTCLSRHQFQIQAYSRSRSIAIGVVFIFQPLESFLPPFSVELLDAFPDERLVVLTCVAPAALEFGIICEEFLADGFTVVLDVVDEELQLHLLSVLVVGFKSFSRSRPNVTVFIGVHVPLSFDHLGSSHISDQFDLSFVGGDRVSVSVLNHK